MDRQEYRDIISAIKNNFKKKDYERVIMYARELPAKKIKENSVLEMIATSYEQLGKYNLARNTLETAYKRMPSGKHTAYKLALVSLKMKDVEGAVQYYEDFCKIAPNDNQRFLLKYEIAKVGKLSIYDRIRILEEYNAKETDDRWMYELARLYHDAGMGDKCAEMCDEIVIWFSDGDYLKRALELKFAHKALTPTQQAMYEKIMQEYIEDYEEPEPVIEEPSFAAEKEAEEFANDFLGNDESQTLFEDTTPVDIPKKQIESHTKKIGLSGSEKAEVKKTVSEIADAKKNIFYDFRIDDAASSVSPGLNAWLNTLPDLKDEHFQKSMREELEEEIAVSADDKEDAEDKSEYRADDQVEDKEEIKSGEKAEVWTEDKTDDKVDDFADKFISEAEFAGRTRKAYSPALESIRETPILEQEFDHKKLEAEEGQLEVNLDLLGGSEDEVDGQMSIDQIFQTYANNIENNLENRAAVAKIEAERLRQIKEAVEQSMPAAPVFDEEEEYAAHEEAITDESIEQPAEDGKDIADAISMEPAAKTEDPVEKIFDDLIENEPEPAMDDKTGNSKDKISFENDDEIQIPEFLKDIKFEDDLEDDDDDVLALSTDDVDKEADKTSLEYAEESKEAGEASFENEEESKDADEAIVERTEAEIEDELDDIGDFLAEVMGKDVEEPVAEDEEGTGTEETVVVEEAYGAEEIEEAAEEEPESEEAEEVEEVETEAEEEEAILENIEDAKDPTVQDVSKINAENDEDLDELGDILAEIFGGSEEDEIEDESGEEIFDAETGEIAETSEETEAENDEAEVDEETEEVSETDEEDAKDASEKTEEDIVAGENTGTDFKAIEAEIADVENIAADDDLLDEDLETFLDEIDLDEDDEENLGAEESKESAESVSDAEIEDEPEDETETVAEEEAVAEEEIESEGDTGSESDSKSEVEPENEIEAEDVANAHDNLGEQTDDDTVEDEKEEIVERSEEQFDESDGEEEIEEASDEEPESEDEPIEAKEQEDEIEESEEEDEETDDVVIKEEDLGDTQSLEKVHKFSLDEETKEEIAEFLLIDGMRETVTNTVNDVIINKRAGDPTGGNLIVTGDAKCGKTFLAISIIKAVNKELQSGSGKVAKVQSESLNGKDIKKVFQKITGNDLIIENVGDLEEKTIDDIAEAMSDGTFNDMLVFEGNMLAVETILNNHPEMEALFANRVDISELSISAWADVACDYAKRKGYRVGDMALLALHAKIDEINLPTKRFGYEDIVNIMEAAIEHCDKRNTGKLFSAFSKKEDEGIELNESDFA